MRLDEQVALAGLSGSSDKTLARQLGTGQRILVSMKKSDFDLEPQQYTGIVKYVGKIDSEFIDNRIYVGVKLDEPGIYILAFTLTIYLTVCILPSLSSGEHRWAGEGQTLLQLPSQTWTNCQALRCNGHTPQKC